MTKYKSVLASKTFWAAFFFVVIGAYAALAPSYGWDTKWVPGIEAILTGLGLYGIRSATTSLSFSGLPPVAPTPPDNVAPSKE